MLDLTPGLEEAIDYCSKIAASYGPPSPLADPVRLIQSSNEHLIRFPPYPRCTNHDDKRRVYQPFSRSHGHRCNKMSWLSIPVFVFCTLVAQVVLTLRHGSLSSFDNSELIPRMPTQDIRRDSGTHSLYSWVCDHYRQSIRAWDIPDDFCREEWR